MTGDRPVPDDAGTVTDLSGTSSFDYSLAVLGERWTLLILRDLFRGRSRFRDFMASPEGISTNILSDRLAVLLRHGIIRKALIAPAVMRPAYTLTEKDQALRPIIDAMHAWKSVWKAT